MLNRLLIDKLFVLWFVIISFTGFASLLSSLFLWQITIAFMSVVSFFLYKNKKNIDLSFTKNRFFQIFFVCYFLFVFHIIISGINHQQYFKTAVYSFKYITILFLLLSLLIYNISRNLIERAIFFAFFINVFVLAVVLIFLNKSSLILILGDGRIGTVFNPVGVGAIWLLADIVFFISVFYYFKDRNKKIFIPIFLSVSVIMLDGTRTGQILLFMAFVLIAYLQIKLNYKICLKKWIFVLGAIVIAAISTEAIRLYVSDTYTSKNLLVLQRYFELFTLLNTDNNNSTVATITVATSAITDNDVTRLQMMKYAMAEVLKQPFNIIGNGIESAKIITTNGTQMIIHMSYLQVWLDYGLIAFFAYTMFIYCCIFYMLSKINTMYNEQRIFLFIPLYIFISYALIAFIHPLSN